MIVSCFACLRLWLILFISISILKWLKSSATSPVQLIPLGSPMHNEPYDVSLVLCLYCVRRCEKKFVFGQKPRNWIKWTIARNGTSERRLFVMIILQNFYYAEFYCFDWTFQIWGIWILNEYNVHTSIEIYLWQMVCRLRILLEHIYIHSLNLFSIVLFLSLSVSHTLCRSSHTNLLNLIHSYTHGHMYIQTNDLMHGIPSTKQQLWRHFTCCLVFLLWIQWLKIVYTQLNLASQTHHNNNVNN